jgi:hypothetical protein
MTQYINNLAPYNTLYSQKTSEFNVMFLKKYVENDTDYADISDEVAYERAFIFNKYIFVMYEINELNPSFLNTMMNGKKLFIRKSRVLNYEIYMRCLKTESLELMYQIIIVWNTLNNENYITRHGFYHRLHCMSKATFIVTGKYTIQKTNPENTITF